MRNSTDDELHCKSRQVADSCAERGNIFYFLCLFYQFFLCFTSIRLEKGREEVISNFLEKLGLSDEQVASIANVPLELAQKILLGYKSFLIFGVKLQEGTRTLASLVSF